MTHLWQRHTKNQNAAGAFLTALFVPSTNCRLLVLSLVFGVTTVCDRDFGDSHVYAPVIFTI